MEGEPTEETFDHRAMAEYLESAMDRLKKMGGELAGLSFNSDEVNRRYEASQTRLGHPMTAEIALEIN